MNMESIVDNTLVALMEQYEAAAPKLTIAFVAVVALIVIVRLVQAILAGALARGKGYSFFGNFLLGLVFGRFALIYQAGRPVSYERECVMQDRLALQTAKELYKLQRARERAQTSSVPKVPVR
jgi:hypothetical protein